MKRKIHGYGTILLTNIRLKMLDIQNFLFSYCNKLSVRPFQLQFSNINVNLALSSSLCSTILHIIKFSRILVLCLPQLWKLYSHKVATEERMWEDMVAPMYCLVQKKIMLSNLCWLFFVIIAKNWITLKSLSEMNRSPEFNSVKVCILKLGKWHSLSISLQT